jgi:beta-glucosidase
MTLAEKIAQLHGVHSATEFRIVPKLSRLGIPPLRITNGPAGVGPGGAGPQLRATALPAPIALAATWDSKLASEYGRLAGEETKALGSDLLEAPDINILRVPQSGRAFEGFGEDPWLIGRLAVAEIEGIQSAGVLANVKHYLANNQETQRGTIDEIIGERTLREIYMPAFRAAVEEADVDSVMCAYPRVNGTYNCENEALLGKTLKSEWRFRGFVSSDFGAVHSTVPSLMAGLDLELPAGQYFSTALQQAVEKGEVAVSRIDDALVRRYTVMIERGMFDQKPIEPSAQSPAAIFAHGAIARRIAENAIVLLKNEGRILPLDPATLNSVALIGPYAVRAMTGGGGSSYVNPYYTIRPEDGIYSHLPSQRRLVVPDGSDIEAAVDAAKRAQVAIVMVGDEEREAYDHSLDLPGHQNQLIAAVAKANPRTVVVLKTGSAVLMPWLGAVPALVEAWYPGEEDGNAVADVLFGKTDPGGRLPLSFPSRAADTLARDPEQYPGSGGEVHYSEGLAVGYRGFQMDRAEPLFPFGFGLSYTTFHYSDLVVERSRATADLKVLVTFRVTNTGARPGFAVPQIYLGYPDITEGNEPPLELKGFQKVTLQPGETKLVHVALDKRAFSYWSVAAGSWKLANGSFKIALGSSSEDILQTAEITLH